MSELGLVVVLDGPAQVGRTTTLHALQEAWPRVRTGPLLEAGLEQTLATFGPTAPRWAQLVLPGSPEADDEAGSPRGHVGFGPLGRELVPAMHRAAAAWARGGFDVALDHALLDRATALDLAAALEGLRVVHVQLTCDPDVLEYRELEAGVGPPGTAVAQLRVLREGPPSDLELDTTETDTEELVEVILAEVARRLRR
ncbi:MAG: phosphotransferase-like protein [Nitriliruptoraceae bacterium]